MKLLPAALAVALGLVVLGGGCGGANPDVATPTLATDTAAVTERGVRYSYDGKTVAELLAVTDTYRTDFMIHLVEGALQRKAPADLSAPERVVLAVEALEREVNDGGYNQFFVNEPSYAREIVASLNEIGCPETARITAGAVAVLGLRPGWTDEQISVAAADIPDDEWAKLDTLDGQFLAYPDPIADRLLTFIRANAAEIRL
jgi:Domain of unknown function (DUF4375)